MGPFDYKIDGLNAYLQSFERIARGHGGNALSGQRVKRVLEGEALNVFGKMPASESIDYDKVKKALLETFSWTEEGFRETFRSAKPDTSETARQSCCRLANYFDR